MPPKLKIRLITWVYYKSYQAHFFKLKPQSMVLGPQQWPGHVTFTEHPTGCGPSGKRLWSLELEQKLQNFLHFFMAIGF